MSELSAAALNGLPDGALQYVIAERLGQKLHCAGLHRLDRGRHVAVARNEDDRHFRPIDDALLKIDATEIGKCHVEDKAARTADAGTFEEILRGREGLWLPTGRKNQQLQRLPH